MRQDEWSKSVVSSVAEAVRWHRKRRKMSAQQLADECDRLGYPVPRSVLTNLENGRRDSVSIAELLVLAAALQVQPYLLLFPVGQVEVVEPLPDVEASPWDAVRWAKGNGKLPDASSSLLEGTETIEMFAFHQTTLAHLTALERKCRDPTQRTEVISTGLLSSGPREDHLHTTEYMLWSIRALMRRENLTPPSLPPVFAYIDDPSFRKTRPDPAQDKLSQDKLMDILRRTMTK